MATDTYNSGILKTQTPGVGWTGVEIDNTRRIFGIGDRVSELSPEQSLFFTYLTKVAKQSIDDTVWKPLEYRHQWQRRNFQMEHVYFTAGAYDDAEDIEVATSTASNTSTHIAIQCDYNHQGKQLASYTSLGTSETGGYSPIFLVPGQVLRINGVAYKLTTAPLYYDEDSAATNWNKTTTPGVNRGGFAIVPLASLKVVSTGSSIATEAIDAAQSYDGQVIGSQWAEGSQAPDGWRDELSDTEFYAQIFKTSVPLMSGSAMATRYRGYQNEWKRIYSEHVMSHKMDIENAMLFGYGKYTNQDSRYSWGMIPFLENNGGKLYTMDYDADVASPSVSGDLPFTYDGLVDLMEDFMAPESGNSGQKLVFTSRGVIARMSKMGADSFVAKSLGANNVFRANLDVKPSKFAPVDVTSIGTSFGSLNFIAHPLFRGDMEHKAVAIDLSNVKYRPLAANGQNRDTFVETNIQDNSTDGRKDQIITEAGLEVNLPETHAVITFKSDSTNDAG